LRLTVLRVLAAAAVVWSTAAAPVFSAPQSSPLQLLDVPYVPQSEALCGGAAAAMVMRYWGATGIYAESFSDLVDRAAGGIRGDDLIRSIQTRGWQAVSMAGDAPLVQNSLVQRRPPIALIEDRPGRFHYVVVVAWSTKGVILHDPARAPFRVLDQQTFLRAWSRSGYWTLVVLPDSASEKTGSASPAEMDEVMPPTAGACGPLVDQGVRLANDGALDDAQRVLETAAGRCPDDVAAWRELAGIHALRKDWRRAAVDARKALARDSRDRHAARILATSLYLEGDQAGALDAWNRIGEPTTDLLDIRGLERTRFRVAARTLGLDPGTLLTSAQLQRAARRLDDMPSVMGSRVSYTPGDNGMAKITAAVIERPLLPTAPLTLVAEGLGMLADREVRVNLASATGGGELFHAAGRWWEARPRFSIGVMAPAPFGGIWGVEGTDERERFGPSSASFQERRRRMAFRVSDWATHALGWESSVAVERWATGTAMSFAGSVQYRLARDRVAVRGGAGAWSGAVRTWTAGSSLDLRSSTTNTGVVWLGRLGGDVVGATAPSVLWPGAGTGHGRRELLRAHPLLHDGVVRAGVFGRGLVHASGEWRRWTRPLLRVIRVAPATFIDIARAYHVPAFADRRAHVDVGAGLRIAVPGAGVLRADVARGLRDGDTALSFAWTR
jgi:hypothetical protein